MFLLAQSLQCPECGSSRVWKAGLRYTAFGDVQRYVCRDCGLRFSDPEFSKKKQIVLIINRVLAKYALSNPRE
jgi:transposase-like protein